MFLVMLILLILAAVSTRRADSCSARADMYPYARPSASGNGAIDAFPWLEYPYAKTEKFRNEQNDLTREYINKCTVLSQLNQAVRERWDAPYYSCPVKVNGKYYYHHNTGLQNQPVLLAVDSLGSEDTETILDPNRMSCEGLISIGHIAFSPDGRYLAYMVSKRGSDYMTIKVMALKDRVQLGDEVTQVKFSLVAWAANSAGFFYSKFTSAGEFVDGSDISEDTNHNVYYHKLGDPQCWDKPVFSRPSLEAGFILATSADSGRRIVVTVHDVSAKTQVYVVDTEELKSGGENMNMFTVEGNFEATTQFVGNIGSEFYFITDKDAPRKKIIKMDITSSNQDQETVVPEDSSPKRTLQDAKFVNGKLILKYLRDVQAELYVFDLETKEKGHDLINAPYVGVECFSGSSNEPELFFSQETFLEPRKIYRHQFQYIEKSVCLSSSAPGFDRIDFTTSDLFYNSTTGVDIPLFVAHRKDHTFEGGPVLLSGYGGFGMALEIRYQAWLTVFLQHLGGAFAVANVRGGGEYGENWHKQGMRENKMNTFDDFIHAAEMLTAAGIADKEKLAIRGVGNGGLMVAACMNQRPDLFAAGISEDGVMDMLRYNLYTVGKTWTHEYGSPDDTEAARWLSEYSPLHNIPGDLRGSRYPATLLLAGGQNNRVPSLHSLKMIATLQCKLGNPEKAKGPLLFRLDPDTGYGKATPTSKQIESAVAQLGFLQQVMDLTWTD